MIKLDYVFIHHVYIQFNQQPTHWDVVQSNLVVPKTAKPCGPLMKTLFQSGMVWNLCVFVLNEKSISVIHSTGLQGQF